MIMRWKQPSTFYPFHPKKEVFEKSELNKNIELSMNEIVLDSKYSESIFYLLFYSFDNH